MSECVARGGAERMRRGERSGPSITERARTVFCTVLLLMAGQARGGIVLTSLVGQLSEGRQLGAATSVGTKALFAGGLGTDLSGLSGVDIYDAAINTWSTAVLSEGRLSLAATAVGGKALFGGGTTELRPWLDPDSKRVDVYDSNTGTWSTASLSEARSNLAATSVAGQALFAGGAAGGSRSDVVDVFDADTGSWSTASLSQARSNLAATSVAGQALFAGGQADGSYSDVVDIYDAATSTWSTASLSEGRSNLAATTAEGVAFFAGGWVGGSLPGMAKVKSTVDMYDAATGTWTTASLSEARSHLAATSVGDFALFGGGLRSDFSASNVVDIYHVPSDTWYTTRLSLGRSNLMATSVGNQALFAGGGYDVKRVDIFEVTDTTNWTRPAASGVGEWSDDTNWDSVIGPLPWDHTYIANGGAARLAGSAQAASVTIGGGGGAGGALELVAGSSLHTPAIHVESGGTLNVSRDWTYDGALTVSGGDVALLPTATLCLDVGGAFQITGRSLNTGGLVVGDTGSASAAQSGGTVTVHQDLYLGDGPGGDGTYELSGDASVELRVWGATVVGRYGIGRFVQTGGGHMVAADLTLGRQGGSAGEYELGGTGALSTEGTRVGHTGSGVFLQIGGAHSVAQELVIGYGTGGDGAYIMRDGALDVGGTLLVGRDGTGRLDLEGGDATAPVLSVGGMGTVLFTGGTLSVGSLTNQGVVSWVGGTLSVTGAGGLTVGPGQLPSSVLGANQALHVSHQLTIAAGNLLALTGGTLSSGSLALENGFLVAPAGLSLDDTGDLTGCGMVIGPLSGGAGRTLAVQGGPLTVGDAASASGFDLAGTLHVGPNTLTILDADRGALGAATTLGPGGAIHAGNGLTLGPGASLTAAGPAGIRGDFTNDGMIHGPGGAGETLCFFDDVDGEGSFTGHIEFRGVYSPGHSPALVAFESLTLSPSGVLDMEVGGTTPGVEHDFLDIAGALTLEGALRVWFVNGFGRAVQESDTILLASAGAPVAGEFANVPSGGSLRSADGCVQFAVYYGPGSLFGANEVVLTEFALVPEPATLVLFGAGAAAALRRRRLPPRPQAVTGSRGGYFA